MRRLDTAARFPGLPEGFAHALVDEPILIDGMRVEFDVKVALSPVTITAVPTSPRGPKAGGGDGTVR